eukprot:1158566-Pelagomonas_calceolata.AAC.3
MQTLSDWRHRRQERHSWQTPRKQAQAAQKTPMATPQRSRHWQHSSTGSTKGTARNAETGSTASKHRQHGRAGGTGNTGLERGTRGCPNKHQHAHCLPAAVIKHLGSLGVPATKAAPT